MKVKKAVILAAGLGTRVLPATKVMPKEMLPIVDKPAIQYIAEEIAAAGIEDILIVLSRGKSIIEDHFDRTRELEAVLEARGRTEMLSTLRSISSLANISFTRQLETNGTAGAVAHARSFAAGEPILVAYADDVILGEDPAAAQCTRAFEETGLGAVAMKEVPPELVRMYSSMKIAPLRDNLYHISDMVEKPAEHEIFSHFSILGRCVLPYEIFDIIEKTPRGAGNEYQLTDAMKQLSRTKGMVGVDFTGTRYDMGNKLGILKATVETGLGHCEVGDDFRAYLKELAKTL